MRWRRLRLSALIGGVAAMLIAAAAFVMSGTPSAEAHHFCPNTGSPFGAFDINTYEAADYKNVYARTFELGAFNQIAPEHSGFALPGIETGNRAAGSSSVSTPYIPPVVLKSISFLESGWAQGSYDPVVEYGEVGPVLSSHDCGYGLMQVTSGMQNISSVPNLEQTMIGTHYAFNVARGARILADKWNMSPETRPVVGNRDSKLIEDWYYALWAYNGFAYSNHPLNPSYQINRVAFSCGSPGDGYGHDRTQYPYQELVLGCVERPPSRTGTQLWNGIPVHLPELNNPAFAGPLSTNNWNACSFSLDCAAMDIPTPNAFHSDTTTPGLTREQVLGQPVMSFTSGPANVTLSPGNQTTITFGVDNSGTGVLGYQATEGSSWLSISDGGAGVALGNELGGDDGTVTVIVDASQLSDGVHTALVTVSSLYASSAPQNYAVTLTVGSPTPPPSLKWGDNDCSGTASDPVDALLALRYNAGLIALTGSCPAMGAPVIGYHWGDVDCIESVTPVDALKMLGYDAGQGMNQKAGCPTVGSVVPF